MDRNKPGYMNFDDIADRLESGKLNAYDVVYTKDTHEVVFIKEDLSLIRMKCRLDVYPSVVVAEYYLNLNTDTYVGQIVGIEQGEWICLYNVNYADNKFIVRKVGVDEYGQLANKPQINGVTLEGNKTTEQLGINIPTKFSQLYDDIGYVTFDHLIENYYSKSQTYSKSEVDTALAGKADTSDIPTDLADLQDDSTHRTVTDENIAAWNAKSNVVANPSETTGALNSIEIDGVAYAVAGSGGGAVHSVNGKTGDVELNASDVHALPDDTPLFSGDYNDLENKPTIPSALGDLTDDTYHRTVTDVEKTQWNAAEPNIQSDWNQSDNTKKDYIKNKPNIPAGQIQSDWSQSDNTKADYIKNKPNIPDAQIQSDWNQTDGSSKDYIKNKPALGTASAKNVPTSGNAGTSEVVMGNDTRLTDARNAADVYSWAKAENKPSYTKSEIGLGNVDNTSDTTKKSNFTGSIASGNTGFATGGDVYSALGDKVDKVEGKDLSTNDYDDTAKGIVDGVTSALADKADKSEMSISTSGDQTTIQLKSGTSATVINAHQDISGKADKSEMSVSTSGDKTTIQLKSGTSAEVLSQHQDISGKAEKSEMSVTDGTGTDADKTTIQLKSGTSATVLKTHQDISSKADKVSGATNGNLAGLDANGNLTDSGIATTDVEEMQDELSTDYATVEGNPINFSTKSAQTAKSTILSLEPIQDLHGYDKPWVGGAGKNIAYFDSSNRTMYHTTFDTENDNDIEFHASDVYSRVRYVWDVEIGQTYTISYKASCTGNLKRVNYANNDNSWDSREYGQQGLSETLTGYTLTFTATTDKLYVVFYNTSSATSGIMKVEDFMLEKGNQATTFTPYENICPISGRTEIGILGCGKNLMKSLGSSTTDKGIVFKKNADNSWDVSGTNDNTGVTSVCIGEVNIISGQTYILSGCPTGGDITNGYRLDLRIDAATIYNNLIDAGNGKTFTATETITLYVYVRVARNYAISGTKTFYPMIRKSTDSADYEQYAESSNLTISFGQTVYGCTHDLENGVLVCDDIKRILNDDSKWATTTGTIDYIYNEDFSDRKLYETSLEGLSSSFVVINAMQSLYGRWQGASLYKFGIKDTNSVLTLQQIKDLALADKLEICYKLATPITINLTPHTINLLKGINNISTDGDKITLTYRNGKFATLDGAVPKMTFRGEDYTMGVDDIGLFLKNLTKSTKTYITDPLLNFDGTVATYKKIMKQWFINNGVNIMDSTGITYLCERWYEITKQGWKGGTSFPAVGVSTGSTGTRFDDNVGMSVTPSTDTSANTDTYQGLPLFAITDCNWELDSGGNILITAIDGITDNFVRDNPTKFVGVMQQTGWVKKVDDASTQKYYYADDKDAYEDLVPLPEAIKLDGTVRSFVVHAKYMSGIVDSKMTCCSGVIPRRNISHDSLVTLPDNIGTQYSGGTSVDWSFLVWMQRIKYASLTSDGVLQGCCNYNYQYYVKVSETGVKRLILSSANGANLKVGSTVTFGAYAGNADRGQAATYSISGQDGAIITAIEDVTIDSTTYKAIYVDTTSTFNTVANGDATNGTTIVSTYHWVSGSCDNVKGNDGSPVSATNGVYPARLQGIEYMVGGYEVFADVIMNISGGYYNPYYARKSTDQATSITSSMVQSTLKCAQPSSDAWRYIQKHGFDGEIFYPVSTGTSSSEYMKDGFYENGTSTSTGTREWLAFGYLATGSGSAGLSCLNGNYPLSSGWWYFVARLSCNGNRGILLTA